MADPYVPGLAAARSVYDQGIAPLAQKVQGFLKGTAGLPGTVKDYALETIQSEGGPTTKVMADLLTLGQGMRQGLQDDPLRFMAEMNPLVGAASGAFESNQLMNQAEQAEQAGDLEKAQKLREIGATIGLLSIIPGTWHGSPHKFNKFSTTKINTGEGSQAFGYGLYFSENPATGTIYKEVLAPVDGPTRGKSYLYEADLDVDRKELMDWDAPLKDQPENVQRVLAPYAKDYTSSDVDAIKAIEDFLDTDYAKSFPNATDVKRAEQILDPSDDFLESIDASEWLKSEMEKGTKSSFFNLLGDSTKAGTIYERMSRKLKNNYFASQKLSEEGVPGIKYWDQESRGEGKGTRNFVIFDDKNVRIKSRDGEPVLPEETPPQTPQELDEVMQALERANQNRARRTQETGLPYVPSNKPDLGEGRRIDINESPQDTALRKELEDKRLADIELDRSPTARAARAEEFGFTTDVFHGTRADFSEFDPNMVDVGIHVGSPSQATNRLLDESSSAVNFSGNIAKGVTRARNRFDEGSQILPLKAKINNVLEMPDVGEWKNSFNVIDGLIKHPKFKDKVPELQEMRKVAEEEGVSYRDEYGDSTWDTSPENRELLNELNTLIRKEGFDTIKYLNEHENNLIRKTKDDPHSYIILDPTNVRSTSADFNPLRMNEADLQAGIASLGAREGMA